VLKYLESQGTNVNVKGNNGWTPLHQAVFESDNSHGATVNALECLIGNGADINTKNNDGETPLYRAVHYTSSVDIVDCLIRNGADINEKDEYGETLLHYAARDGSKVGILKCLISFGANVNTKDNDDWFTPLDLAETEEMKSIFRAAGGKSWNELHDEMMEKYEKELE